MSKLRRLEYQHFYVSRNITNSKGKRITVKEPRVTVCYIRNEVGTAVGIAICSYGDNPCKKIGRGRAYQRALEGSQFIECGFVDAREEYNITQERAFIVLQDSDIEALKPYKMLVVNNPNFRFTRMVKN